MTQLSKESIEDTIEGLEQLANRGIQSVHIDMAIAGMRRLLAVEGQEPVAYLYRDNLHADARFSLEPRFGNWSPEDINEYEITETKLYAAPPAPVAQQVPVPDGLKRAVEFYEQVKRENTPVETGAWKDAVNWVLDEACRAAMLQPSSGALQLPMQSLVIDGHGTLRFKENPIVRKLLDYATERGYGLNEIAMEQFDAEDQMQLAQLIGYSLSGYGTLSYVTDESYDRAVSAAPQEPTK